MKKRAPRNRTLTCSEHELAKFSESLLSLNSHVCIEQIAGRVINQDFFSAAQYLPKESVDLLVMDPPYNLSKNYNGHLFREKEKGNIMTGFYLS